MADSLLQLVLEGKKTATSGLLCLYEKEKEPLPKAGERSMILDSKGEKRCVIEVVEVIRQPFRSVGKDIAFEEGEGDRSLAFWREGHRNFFSKYCDFNEDLEVITERFKVVEVFDQESQRFTSS